MPVSPLTGKAKLAYHRSNARINVYEGSVSSGKTVTSILRWARFVREAPPGDLVMIGKTERTIKRNVINPMIDLFGSRRIKYSEGAGVATIFGRRVYVAGAYNRQAEEKIRGMTIAGVYCDELSLYTGDYMRMLTSRMRVEGARMFATTNPDSPLHWLKTDYLDRAAYHVTGDGRIVRNASGKALDLARFSFRLSDNPHLPAGYIAEIEKEYVGLWHRRFVLGEWVIAEGAVFDMFDPAAHVVTELPQIDSLYAVGVDYGTVNPFHMVLFGLGVDQNLYVMREWRWDSKKERRQKTDAEYSRDLRNWLEHLDLKSVWNSDATPRYITIDPSAASFVTQCHNDRIRGVRLADNDVLPGIRAIASLLGNRRLFIHESCPVLIGELGGYSWDPKAAERGEDKVIKISDHGCDALRYAAYTTRSLWWRRIYGLAA